MRCCARVAERSDVGAAVLVNERSSHQTDRNLLPPLMAAGRSRPLWPGAFTRCSQTLIASRKQTPVQACPCEIRISRANTSQVTSGYRSSPLRFPKQRTSSHLHAPSELSLSSIVAFWSLVE